MRRPWFSYYVDDFELNSKVRLMTAEEEGCYHRLLRYQWRDGSIPSEMKSLAQICRQPTRRMSRLWVALEPCFPLADGQRKNPRMEEERATADKISKNRSEAAYKQHASAGASATEVQSVCKPPCVSQVTSHKKKVIHATWLTPFGKVWKDNYGGEPPWGRLAAALRPLVENYTDDVVSLWERYIKATDAQFASAERFASTYGSWKPKRELKELPDPLNEEGL